MMGLVHCYIWVGMWTYIVTACCRSESLRGATMREIAKGLAFGILCWPVAPLFCLAVDRAALRAKGVEP
jgi:hypothetical protein